MIVKDRFLHFTYNGVHSSVYGAFYENRGEDISFPFFHNVSHTTATPLFQNQSYWLGSDKGSKTFQMDVVVADKTLSELEEIFTWLDPNKPGELIIDYRPNYMFDVLITKMTQPILVPQELPNNMIRNLVFFTITFETIGDHSSQTKHTFTYSKEDRLEQKLIEEPDELLPIMLYSLDTNQYSFINWSGENQYFKFLVNGSLSRISKDKYLEEDFKTHKNVHYYFNISASAPIQIDTQLGSMAIDVAESGEQKELKLLEFVYPSEESINKGPLAIKPGLLFRGNAKIFEGTLSPLASLNPRVELEMVVMNDKIYVNTYGLAQEKDSGDYMLIIEPEIDENTKFGYSSHKDEIHLNGLYPLEDLPNIDGTYSIKRPEYYIGNKNGYFLEFDLGDNGIALGNRRARIAEIQKIQIDAADDYSIVFNYKKGV